jgi:hypothetical protein
MSRSGRRATRRWATCSTSGTLRGDLNDSGEREFLVEGLAAPDYWPNPDPAKVGQAAFDVDAWRDRRDRSRSRWIRSRSGWMSPRPGWRLSPRAAGAPTAASTASCCSPRRDDVGDPVPDGRRPRGRPDRAGDRPGRPGGVAAAADPRRGLDPQLLTPGERSQADLGLARDVVDDQIRLPGEPMPPLDDAVEAATWREIGTAGRRRTTGARAAGYLPGRVAVERPVRAADRRGHAAAPAAADAGAGEGRADPGRPGARPDDRRVLTEGGWRGDERCRPR